MELRFWSIEPDRNNSSYQPEQAVFLRILLGHDFSIGKARLWLAEKAKSRGSHGGLPETGFNSCSCFESPHPQANRVAHEREDDARAELGLGGASRDGEKATPPANEASTVSLAQDATAGLRRTRAMMAEELEKGQRTLVAMSESRAQLRKTGDEYGGSQRAAVGAGGKLLTTLERQAKP